MTEEPDYTLTIIEKDGLFERTGMHPRCADYCGSLALSIVRSSTKRIAMGRPATAPPMPLLKCNGVHRAIVAFTASR